MLSSNPHENDPGLEGPDYVALVIEWNDDAATAVGSDFGPEPTRYTSRGRTLVAVIGALGALLLAAWGLRRLRAA
jgi:hypothetical protein